MINPSILFPDTALFVICGTFHKRYIRASSEGEARKEFHQRFNGESIITIEIFGGRLGQLPPG